MGKNNPTKTTIPETAWWHERGTLSDGRKVGKLGALWYILDSDGKAITEGYHEIEVIQPNNVYEGKRGATTTRFRA